MYLVNSIFSKTIYLFINNYLLPFKVTPLRHNTLMPAFCLILKTFLKRTFWYRQQLLFRFLIYLFNHSKTLSFYRCLQFWKEERVSGPKACEYDGLGMITGLFLAKHSRTIIDLWAGPKSIIGFSTILCVSDEMRLQSAHNFKVVFLIDRTTLWQELIVLLAITIEENSKQNRHIWLNLRSFFRSRLWL